jgi:metaxin
MLNRDFTVRSVANSEFMAPSGKRTKLPVVQIASFLAAEFEPIINLFEHKKMSLTENFDSDDKDEVVTYMSLVENVLTNTELYISWCDNTVYKEITKKRYGDSVYPFPLNHIQTFRKRRAVLKQLNFHDCKNSTFEEIVENVDRLCQTLVQKLGDKEYFFGQNPCELDALVFGHLFCIFTMELPASVSLLKETINKYSQLTQFCSRIEKKYFGKIKN